MTSSVEYDAVLLITFGGPERSDEVVPFLEKLFHGKPIPEKQLEAIVERYAIFDGESPINGQSRALVGAWFDRLQADGPSVPVYWGTRYSHPLLADTIGQMAEDGIKRAAALVASPFGSPYTCRDYLDEIDRACETIGEGSPKIDKLRAFFNHPGFIEATAQRVREAFAKLPEVSRESARLVFTVHGLPVQMAEAGPYVRQIEESCRLVAEAVDRAGVCGQPDGWDVVYQSIPSRTIEPWLEPEIGSQLVRWHEADELDAVVLVPIGFVFENLEVVYDLDFEIGPLCEKLGVPMVRSAPVASHEAFVEMACDLVRERMAGSERAALGSMGPGPDRCADDCCRLKGKE